MLRRADGTPFTGDDFDGEGIVVTPEDDLLISSETEPSVRRFGIDGALRAELAVPARFGVAPRGEARTNQTFEGLTLTPSAQTLFVTLEGPLAPDAQTAAGENRIRMLRYRASSAGGGFEPAEQLFYRTEPGQGVTEILALGRRRLIVLERGFVAGQGNTVRLFEVSLRGAEDVSDEATLSREGLEPVRKTLLVDLGACPPSGATNPGPQVNPLLDNFESMTFGPELADERRSLLLQSDDNFAATQLSRLVLLGVEL